MSVGEFYLKNKEKNLSRNCLNNYLCLIIIDTNQNIYHSVFLELLTNFHD